MVWLSSGGWCTAVDAILSLSAAMSAPQTAINFNHLLFNIERRVSVSLCVWGVVDYGLW